MICASQVKKLHKVKERVRQDMINIFEKVRAWVSAPMLQRLGMEHEFKFMSALTDIRDWSMKDVFKGRFPWMQQQASGNQGGDDVKQAMMRSFAQRLRVTFSVSNLVAYGRVGPCYITYVIRRRPS